MLSSARSNLLNNFSHWRGFLKYATISGSASPYTLMGSFYVGEHQGEIIIDGYERATGKHLRKVMVRISFNHTVYTLNTIGVVPMSIEAFNIYEREDRFYKLPLLDVRTYLYDQSIQSTKFITTLSQDELDELEILLKLHT
jgi:hypothetical protein